MTVDILFKRLSRTLYYSFCLILVMQILSTIDSFFTKGITFFLCSKSYKM